VKHSLSQWKRGVGLWEESAKGGSWCSTATILNI